VGRSEYTLSGHKWIWCTEEQKAVTAGGRECTEEQKAASARRILLYGEQEIYHRAEEGAVSYYRRGYPQIRERRPLH
jgi:hypothetical protein